MRYREKPLRRWSLNSRLLVLVMGCSLVYYLFFTGRLGTRDRSSLLEVNRGDGKGRREGWEGEIGNSTLGFQKLIVINMPSRTDRRDAITLSAAVSNLEVEFIAGVGGDSIPEAAFPPGKSRDSIKLSKGIKGSWRSHMNALQMVVHQNLTTAVIFEDDVDWDVRLRSQLNSFAQASRFLTSPATDLSRYPILQTANPETPELSIHNDSSKNPIATTLHSLALNSIPSTSKSISDSIYGAPANWDLLWLGHCGAGFPRPDTDSNSSPSKSNLILTNPNDPTVPAPQHLKAHPFGPLDALATSHPAHTRVYHRASGGALCTIAYAVSQRGARRLLHEFGIKNWGRIWDVELGDWCAGFDEIALDRTENGKSEIGKGKGKGKSVKEGRRGERVCITAQPPIFAHHHPAGGESNIGGLGGGYARSVETKYVRKSVRMNLEALVRGDGVEGLVDQWPD